MHIGGGGDAQILGGFAEGASLRHAQEGLEAIKQIARDCVAVLHGPTIIAWINLGLSVT